jgi:hypothetical protein
MRRLVLLSLVTLAVAVPLHAAKGQSYFTYDDGGTIIRQADDGRDTDARVNVPVFPGDEVITSRRGRSEIRLSDGNVIALDRSTDIRFRSILDSYDGDGTQTVAELRYGHIVAQRIDDGGSKEFLRIDTDSASYVATDEAIYAVDSDRGSDRIVVFDGSVEVRTPTRRRGVRPRQRLADRRRRLRAVVPPPRGALRPRLQPLSRPLPGVRRLRPEPERLVGLRQQLQHLVLASARGDRMASVLLR